MKNKTIFISVLALLLIGTSCVKERSKSVLTVSTFAGSGAPGSADGRGTQASFNHPNRVAFDKTGNLYVSDLENGVIRKINTKGDVTTLAGASFYLPWGLAVDASDNIYVADYSNHIYKISPAGLVIVFAGSGQEGSADGKGTAASFKRPRGMAFDAAGNLYVSDEGNNLIRKITPDAVVTTLAGSGIQGSADGKGTEAQFYLPDGIAVDAAGNLYVADVGNYEIRKISPAGVVTTFAGNTSYGAADGQGTAASFHFPSDVVFDATGNLYVADYGNNKIRKITPQGMVTTVAGTGDYGFANGPGASAMFKAPVDLAINNSGDIYVADQDNNMIRRIAIK